MIKALLHTHKGDQRDKGRRGSPNNILLGYSSAHQQGVGCIVACRGKAVWDCTRLIECSGEEAKASKGYAILFYSILFYSILFYSILFYSILFYPILSYPILSYPILSYPIHFHPLVACQPSAHPHVPSAAHGQGLGSAWGAQLSWAPATPSSCILARE